MAASRAAISVSEFVAACTKQGVSRWKDGIGLCVSGGPDSMALAALFGKIHSQTLEYTSSSGPLGRVKAFIVDHQARDGSAEEAMTVAKRLGRLGLDTEILKIQWPPGTIPAQLPNFETCARTERYRLLAHAAIRNNVKSLYLGHHQDDQVENFLMRLTGPELKGDLPPSNALVGMRREASIPCCHDIYGAFEANSVASAADVDNVRIHLTQQGLGLLRPFLSFPKARLKATCEAMGVQFVTDRTNLDPTSTRRNTIRHLLAHHKLPRALHQSSLLETHSSIQEKVLKSVDGYRTALWRLLKIQKFELRSGLLSVQFPKRSELGSEEDSFASMAYVLTDLLDAVSPKPRGSVTIPSQIVEAVIDGVYGDTTGPHETTPKAFVNSIAGVLIESRPHGLLLTRQPIRSTEQGKLRNNFFVAATQAEASGDPKWTDWLFWDNRYWLRIKLAPFEEPDDYEVRPYTEADVAYAYTGLRSLSPEAMKTCRSSIEDAAPGKVRFTLPVIARRGIVTSLPTLNIRLPDESGRLWGESFGPGMPWQIRFKRQISELEQAGIVHSA